jgi:cell wall-associated NlpC family hydrolase
MYKARRITLTTLSFALAAALYGSVARADPGAPGIPGQGQIDKAKADVQARKTAADALLSLTAARQAQDGEDARLGALAAAMYRQGPDLTRLASLVHLGSLREFTDREQALRKISESEANAVEDARGTAQAAHLAQQKAEDAATAQQAAEQQARTARDAAQAAAVSEQAQVGQIKAQREAVIVQLAAAQGVEVGFEQQRQQGLAEQSARDAAVRSATASASASGPASSAAASGRAAAGAPPAGADPIPHAVGPVRTMLAFIYAQLGKPYVWGGAGPDVFDCSGLAMRGLEAAGWDYPHPAQWQYLAMHPLSYSELMPGDLVFWADNPADPHTIYHEAIAIGGDRIIQAPRPGGVVEVQSLWVNGVPSFYARP